MNRDEIHTINQDGNRKIVSRKEYDKIQEYSHDETVTEYYFDADWYLSNGCMTLDEMFQRIEN